MIIKIENLGKSFGDRKLFSNFNFIFNEKKFYSIIGESGTGKTTLLNILSLNGLEYEGEIQVDQYSYKKMHEKERRDFRLRNFGFVFQNFNLFEEDTVYNNLRVTLDATIKCSEEVKRRRVNEILSILKIENLKNQFVKNLSGGEKQRVAIGRALITSPEVIFCDEPTGSLDQENTTEIFNILRNISQYATIIVVTHDEENAKKYSDCILKLEDEKIIPIFHKQKFEDDNLSLMKLKEKKKDGILSLNFIFSHFKNLFKVRKIRNLVKYFLLSVSLISSGLAMTLTTSLNKSISSSFSSIVSSNEVVLTKKNSSNSIIDYYSSNNQTIQSLLVNYPKDIKRYGVNYLVDFENYFIDGNDLYNVNSNSKKRISGFSARHFNEYICIDDYEKYTIYPKQAEPLKSDEVILSLTFDQMKEICLDLHILRDFESLGEYLSKNDYFVSLELINNSWQYSDEQIFKLKGVIFDNKNRVYHTDNLFNETLFEEQMRFPSSNNINKIEEYPWMFKKVYFIETMDYQNVLLNKLFYDEKYKDNVFDSDSIEYRPLTYESSRDSNRVYVYDAFKDSIGIDVINTLNEFGFDYENYYFSSSAGYYNDGTNIFTGFNNPTFFSLYQEDLNEIIDAHSRVAAEDIYNIETPDNVVDAFALKTSSDNVKFKVVDTPISLSELIISGGFAEILGKNKDIIDNNLYVTMLVQSELNDGILNTTFKTLKLTIKDVIEEDKSVSIYHNKDYSISLFRDLFKISSFRLIPNSIIFEMDNRVDEIQLEKLNSLFEEYEFKNPLLEIERSIEESTTFLRYILYGFSILSIISSLILSFIITFINANEQKGEIKLFITLGLRNREIFKMFFIDNLVSSIFCILSSILSLIFINFFVSKSLGSIVGLSSLSLFNFFSVFVILIIALIVVLVSSLATRSVILENSPKH